jgi:hypothetical protein
VASKLFPRFQPAPISATICDAFNCVIVSADAGDDQLVTDTPTASTTATSADRNLPFLEPTSMNPF